MSHLAPITELFNPFTAEKNVPPTARGIDPDQPPQLRGLMRIYASKTPLLIHVRFFGGGDSGVKITKFFDPVCTHLQ